MKQRTERRGSSGWASKTGWLAIGLTLATMTQAQEARPGAGPKQPDYPPPPAVAVTGFKVPGTPSKCLSSIEQSGRSDALGFTQSTDSVRVAGTFHVNTATVCLPTADPKVQRVVVATFSTDPATTTFYQADLRARILQYAQGQPMTGSGAVPIMTGNGAGITLRMLSGRGPAADMAAARATANQLGMSIGNPTPGGEVVLTGRGAQVVVASSRTSQPMGGLAIAYQTSAIVLIGSSTYDHEPLGREATDAVLARIMPQPVYLR
ncbi:hypothetical protein [Sphingomonas bacterium]|uniref:hypothetical protein n=1 Tax=Sphingomonas bacterium TaxID=1895847 RepID=UPI0015754478|nr:hypothetical protein [Sphingomonas bacterium]